MNEHELRLIVREAVARHLGGPAVPPSPIPHPPFPVPQSSIPNPQSSIHPSHALYAGLVNVTDACVIEPAVACDHCGFCKSHGH
jgi:hypothetical protein